MCIPDLLQPLEDVIRKWLLTALTGKPALRGHSLLCLESTRFGGLNIPVLTGKASLSSQRHAKLHLQLTYASDHRGSP